MVRRNVIKEFIMNTLIKTNNGKAIEVVFGAGGVKGYLHIGMVGTWK